MKIEEGFQIQPYEETHPYTGDSVLPRLLRRLLSAKYLSEVESDLIKFGDLITHEVRNITPLVHPPQITQYDQLGRRIDRLDTSEGWRKIKDIAIKEGIVAIPYERKQEEFSRIYGFAKLFLIAGDSHVIYCPMAMTDGAARVLELFGTEEMKDDIRSRIISRDPFKAFTSGQWMTERPGGSDVSQTETTAKPATNDPVQSSERGARYFLDGFKWFSSATDSNVSIALARTGSATSGSRGLSLFLVPLRLPLSSPISVSPNTNGIFVHRLKNKIGTHAVPTAELSLNNTQAFLLSPLNEGVKAIVPVLNITRVYCAINSLGCLRRALDIARSYALVRQVSIPGTQDTRTLRDTPLHMTILANITITYKALTHLAFGIAALLGKSECAKATENEEARLRFLTPVLKAHVSERAVAAMEECMACLGGLGYMEEVGIGRLIRDCLVEGIWEGTSNVLALDMVRASNKTFPAFMEWALHVVSSSKVCEKDLDFSETITSLSRSIDTLKIAFQKPLASLPFVQRPLLYLVAHTSASLYLLEHVMWEYTEEFARGYWKIDSNISKRYVGNTLEGLRIEVETLMQGQDADTRRRDDLEIVYRTDHVACKL